MVNFLSPSSPAVYLRYGIFLFRVSEITLRDADVKSPESGEVGRRYVQRERRVRQIIYYNSFQFFPQRVRAVSHMAGLL